MKVIIWKLLGCVFLWDIILSLHDLSCQPEDVQNYIDRSLLLTHGFVPIIEASHVQRGHDDHELIMIIEMLLDGICTYVIIHVVLRGSTFHTYCFCVFLSHLLWLCFTFVSFLASFHTCPFNIQTIPQRTETHLWQPQLCIIHRIYSDTAVQSTYPCHGGNKAVSCESQLLFEPFDESEGRPLHSNKQRQR